MNGERSSLYTIELTDSISVRVGTLGFKTVYEVSQAARTNGKCMRMSLGTVIEFAPAARAPDRKIRIRYRLPADKQVNNFGDDLMSME